VDFATFLSEIIIQKQIHLLENGRAGKNEINSNYYCCALLVNDTLQ